MAHVLRSRLLPALILSVMWWTAASTASAQSIGYPSVAAAYADLVGRPGASVYAAGEFVVVTESSGLVVWTFTQPPHPAHPAVARRAIVERNGAIFVDMAILCEAARRPCDRLVRDFEELNEQMRQAIINGR